MLSEGKTTVDNTFVIEKGEHRTVCRNAIQLADFHTGTLIMYLDKETYDKAGLVGQPHRLKGRRGLKPRWSMSSPQITVQARSRSVEIEAKLT